MARKVMINVMPSPTNNSNGAFSPFQEVAVLPSPEVVLAICHLEQP